MCPFKGLAPFDADDAEFFFGRERLGRARGAARGRAAARDRRAVRERKVVAPLRAGLLPALERRCRRPPGERRAAELAAAADARRPGERVVVAVDQFEELFAPSVAEDERAAFVDALVEAAWDPERRA